MKRICFLVSSLVLASFFSSVSCLEKTIHRTGFPSSPQAVYSSNSSCSGAALSKARFDQLLNGGTYQYIAKGFNLNARYQICASSLGGCSWNPVTKEMLLCRSFDNTLENPPTDGDEYGMLIDLFDGKIAALTGGYDVPESSFQYACSNLFVSSSINCSYSCHGQIDDDEFYVGTMEIQVQKNRFLLHDMTTTLTNTCVSSSKNFTFFDSNSQMYIFVEAWTQTLPVAIS